MALTPQPRQRTSTREPGPRLISGLILPSLQSRTLVHFTDKSTGNPISWSWNLGDGTTSTDQSPYHNYKTAGSYTVSLTVTNPFGTDTATKTGFINAGGAPGSGLCSPPPPR